MKEERLHLLGPREAQVSAYASTDLNVINTVSSTDIDDDEEQLPQVIERPDKLRYLGGKDGKKP